VKYNILFTESAEKQLKKLGTSVQKLIIGKLKKLDIVNANNNVKNLLVHLTFIA
jgi:mRNA-degrading endonuclease RelE of RelBE toxin-antitoxin system